ncbi:MAG: tyrosine-type recombinase/integrase [Bosea sp. (in: a-proteobacteria)]|nr:tyrosine-type recombinase/integrase [Bosea sp. (in: a-proteobacteria)]
MTIRANPAMTRDAVRSLAEASIASATWTRHEDEVLGRVAAGQPAHPLENATDQRDKMMGLSAFLRQAMREGVISADLSADEIRTALVTNALTRARVNAAEGFADMYASLPSSNDAAITISWEGDVTPPADCPLTPAQIQASLRSAKPGERVQDRMPLSWVIGSDRVGTGAIEARSETADGPATDATAPVVVVPSWKGMCLSQIWPIFLSDAVAKKRIDEPQAIQGKSTYKLLIEFFDDVPLDQITRPHIANLIRQLQKLPSQYSRGEFGRLLKAGSSFADIISLAGDLDQGKPHEERIPKLKGKTVNRHLSLFNLLWEYGIDNGAVPAGTETPTKGLFLPVDVDVDDEEGSLIREKGARDMWEPEQLKELFALPFFVGCRSDRERLTIGTCIPRTPLWWGVIIAAHHGMRREEVFQLRVRHIVRDEDTGIWYFDLKTDKTLKLKGDKRKDKPSRRFVPLHKNLLRLGFLAARVDGRNPDERLFPEITAANQQNSWGAAPGRRFSVFKIAAGFPPELDFHAFRHSVCTLLYRVIKNAAHAEEMVGHASPIRKSTFRVYNKGQTLTALKEDIDKLDIPIDIDRILAAIAKAPPATFHDLD